MRFVRTLLGWSIYKLTELTEGHQLNEHFVEYHVAFKGNRIPLEAKTASDIILKIVDKEDEANKPSSCYDDR